MTAPRSDLRSCPLGTEARFREDDRVIPFRTVAMNRAARARTRLPRRAPGVDQFHEHCWVAPFVEDDVPDLARHLPIERILFGSDLTPDPDMYAVHYRFLETLDESFDYGTGGVPEQGRWQIHGIGLPDDVLRKVYSDNARRLLRLESA